MTGARRSSAPRGPDATRGRTGAPLHIQRLHTHTHRTDTRSEKYSMHTVFTVSVAPLGQNVTKMSPIKCHSQITHTDRNSASTGGSSFEGFDDLRRWNDGVWITTSDLSPDQTCMRLIDIQISTCVDLQANSNHIFKHDAVRFKSPRTETRQLTRLTKLCSVKTRARVPERFCQQLY